MMFVGIPFRFHINISVFSHNSNKSTDIQRNPLNLLLGWLVGWFYVMINFVGLLNIEVIFADYYIIF